MLRMTYADLPITHCLKFPRVLIDIVFNSDNTWNITDDQLTRNCFGGIFSPWSMLKIRKRKTRVISFVLYFILLLFSISAVWLLQKLDTFNCEKKHPQSLCNSNLPKILVEEKPKWKLCVVNFGGFWFLLHQARERDEKRSTSPLRSLT